MYKLKSLDKTKYESQLITHTKVPIYSYFSLKYVILLLFGLPGYVFWHLVLPIN